ncbi:unnamed protein product [Discosporangium mesarthrocarpum]
MQLGKWQSIATAPRRFTGVLYCLLLPIWRPTLNLALLLAVSGEKCELSAFTDAGYAGNVDDRRSVTGGAIMFYGGAISWMSKTQRVVALSSTESEYYALSSVAQEFIFLRSVLEFVRPSLPITCIEIFEDND